jgi:hypothetical protein
MQKKMSKEWRVINIVGAIVVAASLAIAISGFNPLVIAIMLVYGALCGVFNSWLFAQV